MLELAKFIPLKNHYIYKVKEINIKEISKQPSSIIYLDNPKIGNKLFVGLDKLLKRKRNYIVYIVSDKNCLVKEKLKNHENRSMISYIYDYDNLKKEDKPEIHDYIHVDLKKDIEKWNELIKYADTIYSCLIIKNPPKMEEIKRIPNNFRFEFDYETDK